VTPDRARSLRDPSEVADCRGPRVPRSQKASQRGPAPARLRQGFGASAVALAEAETRIRDAGTSTQRPCGVGGSYTEWSVSLGQPSHVLRMMVGAQKP
jgi:hypothetical protein